MNNLKTSAARRCMGIISVAALLCFLAFAQAPLFAQEQQAKDTKQVTNIAVKGNINVSTLTILSKVKSRPGVVFSQAIVNDDIQRLYSTGFFIDVTVDISDFKGGVGVTFIVKERPILKKIEITGNKKIRTEALMKSVKSKTGEILDRKRLKDDTDEIKKLYEKKGFSLAKIDAEVDVDKDTNHAAVKIVITEGKRLRVGKISVVGNKSIPAKRIVKVMRTNRGNFLFPGYLKEDVLDEDMDRVKSFYQKNGYVDVVVDKKVQYDEKNKLVNITVEVQEGKKYVVGEVKIEGTRIFSSKELFKRLKMLKGSVFSPDGLKDDVTNIQGFYYEKGYIFAEVSPDSSLSQSTGKVDVTYRIVENEVAYIDKIDIRGNTKTKDVVIRRELRVKPGERFDGQKLQRSKERLYNLQFFDEVTFDTEPGRTMNKRNLIVNVKETKTGQFSFGGGFSSVDKLVGFVEVEQRNFDAFNWPGFTGAGQDLKLRAQFGSTRQDFLISWTDPWIFGKPVSFGFDAFYSIRERSHTAGYGYDQRNIGFDLRLGKEFGEYLNGGLMYKLEQVDIKGIPDSATQDLKDEAGKNIISSMSGFLTRDTRDSVYSPTRGNITTISAEVAGGPFFGDKNYWKTQGDTDFYFSPLEKIVLETRLRAGIADSYGNTKKVPIYDRYYAGGGDTIRGYEERRVGPKDPGTNDPVGGDSMLIFNAEMTFPIVTFLKGAVFYDAGNVWEKIDDFGSGPLRQGAGVGVRIKTPIGPIKVDYGYPLNPEKGEKKKGRFHFSVSHGF